jgi:hypothetical protein
MADGDDHTPINAGRVKRLLMWLLVEDEDDDALRSFVLLYATLALIVTAVRAGMAGEITVSSFTTGLASVLGIGAGFPTRRQLGWVRGLAAASTVIFLTAGGIDGLEHAEEGAHWFLGAALTAVVSAYTDRRLGAIARHETEIREARRDAQLDRLEAMLTDLAQQVAEVSDRLDGKRRLWWRR